MPTPITPQQLQARMAADAPYALIDVREVGEYNASHIPGSSLIPRGRLEFELAQAVPHPDTTLILCDDDARRVTYAPPPPPRRWATAMSPGSPAA